MALRLEQHKSLVSHNSFGFAYSAEMFASASGESEIEEAVEYAKKHKLALMVIGEGSNLVIHDDVPGLLLHLSDSHTMLNVISPGKVRVSAAAGLHWQALVAYTLANEAQGLENLSLIPGSVGAAPVQNIGAYGVEVKERIHKVRALHVPTQQWVELTATDCRFSYRHSLFKDHPDEYIISQVQFDLGSQHAPRTTYATLKQHLTERGLQTPTARQISESVIAIRQQRLPNPAITGNAGSFFHNPIVDASYFRQLQARHPTIVSYPQPDGSIKLAAGWLIDQLGYKGLDRGGVGVHKQQALVLINTGSGTGAQVLSLAREIQIAVQNAYGVLLTIEPRIVPVLAY